MQGGRQQKSTLLLNLTNNNLSLFTLQSNLLKIWTEQEVDRYYQTTMLSYLDSLPEHEAKRQIMRQHQKMIQNKSQYSRIKEYINQRDDILDALDETLQDQKQIEAACELLDQLRKINLKLCQSIFGMKQSLQQKGLNANAICQGYKYLFKSFQKDNQSIIQSYLCNYIQFARGYDPLFLAPYQKMQKKGMNPYTPRCVQKLFKMNISYVYRLIRAKNQLVKSLSYACGDEDNEDQRNRMLYRSKAKGKRRKQSQILQDEQQNQQGEDQIVRESISLQSSHRQSKQLPKDKLENGENVSSIPKQQVKLPRIDSKSKDKESTRRKSDSGSRVTIKKKLGLEDQSPIKYKGLQSIHTDSNNRSQDEIDQYRKKIISKKIKPIRNIESQYTGPDESPQRRTNLKQNRSSSSYTEQMSNSSNLQSFRQKMEQNLKKMKKPSIHEQYEEVTSEEEQYARRRIKRQQHQSPNQHQYISITGQRDKFLQPLKLNRKKTGKFQTFGNEQSELSNKNKNKIWKYQQQQNSQSEQQHSKSRARVQSNSRTKISQKYVNKPKRPIILNQDKYTPVANSSQYYGPAPLNDYNNPITYTYPRGGESRINPYYRNSMNVNEGVKLPANYKADNPQQYQNSNNNRNVPGNNDNHNYNSYDNYNNYNNNNRNRSPGSNNGEDYSNNNQQQPHARYQTPNQNNNPQQQRQQRQPVIIGDRNKNSFNEGDDSSMNRGNSSSPPVYPNNKNNNNGNNQNVQTNQQNQQNPNRKLSNNFENKNTNYYQMQQPQQQQQQEQQQYNNNNNNNQSRNNNQNNSNINQNNNNTRAQGQNSPNKSNVQSNRNSNNNSVSNNSNSNSNKNNQNINNGSSNNNQNNQNINIKVPANQNNNQNNNKSQASSPTRKFRNSFHESDFPQPKPPVPNKNQNHNQNQPQIQNQNPSKSINQSSNQNPNQNQNQNKNPVNNQSNIQPQSNPQQSPNANPNLNSNSNSNENSKISATEPQKIQMKPQQKSINQLLTLLDSLPQNQNFPLPNVKQKIKNCQSYLTNFYINNELSAVGISIPFQQGNYQIIYWGIVSNNNKGMFLFEKYVEYLQKFTNLDSIVTTASIFAQSGFKKDGDFYIRNRMSKQRKQLTHTAFLSMQCSNLCFKQDSNTHAIFYSEQIQDFKAETTYTSKQIACALEQGKGKLLSTYHFHNNLKSMNQVNGLLEKYQADTFATSEQINIGQCKMAVCMQDMAIKRNQFYAKNGFFMAKGALVYENQQTKSSVCRLLMQKQGVCMYFGKKLSNVSEFVRICSTKPNKAQKQILFAFKMFSKQTYGRMKNQEYLTQGCYGNWDITFVWQDQLKGIVNKNLPDPLYIFGPEDYFVGIFKGDVLLYSFQVNSNDFAF